MKLKNKRVKASEVGGIENLIEKAIEMRREKEAEAKIIEEQNEKRRTEFIKQGNALMLRIESEKEQVEKMMSEYEALLQEKEQAHLIKFEKSERTKKHVEDGTISVSEFISKGVEDGKVEELASDKARQELSEAASIIRQKNLGIIELECDFYDLQCKIYNMSYLPAKTLREWYRQMGEFLDESIGPYVSSIHTAKYQLQEKKAELEIAKHGFSPTTMSMGHTWNGLSLRQAYLLSLNPVLVEEGIDSLLSQLSEIESEYKGKEVILTVQYYSPESHWPGDMITVKVEGIQ